MVPDKFNMVDMGGIDLIMMQGEEVPGLYDRLVESITQCRYQCLYNWLFDGVIIPPTYVEMEVNEDEEVAINEGVTVSEDDVIHIYSLEPAPVDPKIIPLLVDENGTYNVPLGVDGFNPVTVDVPSYTPVIDNITITQNGTYTAPAGTDGYSPIAVNVPSGAAADLFDGLIEQVSFTSSGLNDSPSDSTHNTRVRSINYIPVTGNESYLFVVHQVGTYVPQISVSYYTANDYATSRIGVTDWLSNIAAVKIPSNATYMRFLIRKSTNGSITPSEVDAARIYSVSEIEGQ